MEKHLIILINKKGKKCSLGPVWYCGLSYSNKVFGKHLLQRLEAELNLSHTHMMKNLQYLY